MSHRFCRACLVLALALASVSLIALAAPSAASADIQSPGDHPSYGLELAGHLVVQWHDEGFDEAIGPGFRAYFPVIPSGPVTSINNSLAVGTGLDLTFSDAQCGPQNCDNWQIWLPLTVQWNFYFSREFSVFPELGLAFQYLQFEDNISAVCEGRRCDDDDIDIEPVFWIGARYQFAKTVGVTLRLGTPSLLLGLSFFM